MHASNGLIWSKPQTLIFVAATGFSCREAHAYELAGYYNGDPSVLVPLTDGQVAQLTEHLHLLRAGRFLRIMRNGKQIICEPCDDRVFCILAELINHIVRPPADDDK